MSYSSFWKTFAAARWSASSVQNKLFETHWIITEYVLVFSGKEPSRIDCKHYPLNACEILMSSSPNVESIMWSGWDQTLLTPISCKTCLSLWKNEKRVVPVP